MNGTGQPISAAIEVTAVLVPISGIPPQSLLRGTPLHEPLRVDAAPLEHLVQVTRAFRAAQEVALSATASDRAAAPNDAATRLVVPS